MVKNGLSENQSKNLILSYEAANDYIFKINNILKNPILGLFPKKKSLRLNHF